jgi:hypothetical protein
LVSDLVLVDFPGWVGHEAKVTYWISNGKVRENQRKQIPGWYDEQVLAQQAHRKAAGDPNIPFPFNSEGFKFEVKGLHMAST